MEFLQDAHTWEAAGLVIFLGVLIYLKVPGMAVGALDARGAKIRAQLDEATRLREEAERRIALAETQAATEVKAAAADLAAQAAEAVLAARLAAAKSDPLVDAAVALIPTKLQ